MTRWSCAAALVCMFAPLWAQAPDEAIDARQVHWQRCLDDALTVAAATGKPLLLAINMDGESASDRIVHEQYRDPEFVALTRRCVCLGASVFRHNARDHDDDGRRIPCPRFGGITCGEHIALEPVLWEKYLADGERVAPRHALVLADGRKAFDISLSFDLKDIDRALAAAVAGRSDGELPATGEDWSSLAARRDANGRAAFEAALAAADEASLRNALAALEANGDAGAVAGLRRIAARLPSHAPRLTAAFVATVARLGLATPVDELLQAFVRGLGAVPGDAGPDARQAAWLRAMSSPAEGQAPAAASFLLANGAAGVTVEEITRRWPEHGTITDAVLERGGPVDLAMLLQVANGVTRHGESLPRTGGPTDAMPEESELLQALQGLDAEQAQRRGDAEWHAAFAKASLDLGRRHLETSARDTQLLLEDAASHFRKAVEQVPDRYEWWIESARSAYFLQRFDEQIASGVCAFTIAAGLARPPAEHELTGSPVLQDARAIEALRWIGDGHARLLAARAGNDPAIEIGGMIDGLRALGLVAASAFGREKDWISFGSFAGAIGLWRQEQAIVQAGATRFPASRDLRQALNAALWNCGRSDLSGVVAEQVLRANAPSAEAEWFAGYAWLLVAEDARRTERPWAAVDAYDTALRWFAGAAVRNPAYLSSCDHYAAVAHVGRGHAFAQAGERDRGAEALLAAVQKQADLSSLRDGLGYDVLDLVDKLTEWRGDGSAPVRPLPLLERMDAIAPGGPFWAAAVSDSALREALRADGRNPDRALRKTVDAAGNEITMPMGKPTDEGDEWLHAALEAARAAAARGATDADQQPLAQSATIAAERLLERERLDGVRDALVEAAAAMGWEAPAEGANEAALRACAEQFRARLGPARPRLREGR